MLTDAQWVVLEPLIEACRPPAKVPLRHLWRTISAILWRHTNGAKWRALPDELGPWWMFKLRVERLPVRAHAGIAKTAVFQFCIGHNLRKV